MPTTEKNFGLRIGQLCLNKDTKMTHRSRWYLKDGTRIGYGDLSSVDFKNIASGLENDELFIVLPESSSEWNDTDLKTVEHLVVHALYVITKKSMFYIERHLRGKGARAEKGFVFLFMTENELRELIKSTP